MIPEKVRVDELLREDLQVPVLQLMDRVRELEEQLRVKRTPPNYLAGQARPEKN